MSLSFENLLSNYSASFEKKLQAAAKEFNCHPTLKEACGYALLNGGKRLRPAFVLMIANAIGKGFDASEAALAIEYFHTASLVADDLPCMDNDNLRRNKPTVHTVYGEATALLVSYALIAAGYECLAKNARLISKANSDLLSYSQQACLLALENASHNTGIAGATGGQFLDLYPPNLQEATLREIIKAKTGALFETAFVLGWLFGGGAISELEHVKRAAQHFGMAFQIADDLGDIEQDRLNQRAVNMAAVIGKEAAERMFHEELEGFIKILFALPMKEEELLLLSEELKKKVGVISASDILQ